jgi:hypothetical protein
MSDFLTPISVAPQADAPQTDVPSLQDSIQMALAIATESVLQSIVTHCIPPLAHPQQVGSVTAKMAVPVPSSAITPLCADGILQVEVIRCVLADPQDMEQYLASHGDRDVQERYYAKLTRYESDVQDMGRHLSLSQAIALLNHAGFSAQQTHDILHLSYEATHKTWWYLYDASGKFLHPFHRTIRTLRYPDGRLTIQYKDRFAEHCPPCFRSQSKEVLLDIQTGHLSFHHMLSKLNGLREAFHLQSAILIYHHLTELEIQAFISQGISLYSTTNLWIPSLADCACCLSEDCPLHGTEHSPVTTCQHFRLPSS